MTEAQYCNYFIRNTLKVYFYSGIILGLILMISLKITGTLSILYNLLLMLGTLQAAIISWIFFYILIINANRNNDNIPHVILILILTSSVVFIPSIIISYGIVYGWWFNKGIYLQSSNQQSKRSFLMKNFDKKIEKKRLQQPPLTSSPELDEYFWSLYKENMDKGKIIRMLSFWISNRQVETGEIKSLFEATKEAQNYYKKIEVIENELNEEKQQ